MSDPYAKKWRDGIGYWTGNPPGETTMTQQKPMRVHVNPNAARNYVRRCYRHAHPACGMLHSIEFMQMLEQVQGQWLEVETKFLFADQFNTGPIPGVSESGLRLMIGDVDAIENDVRPGRQRCQWRGAQSPVGGPCSKCNRDDHLFPFQTNPQRPERVNP